MRYILLALALGLVLNIGCSNGGGSGETDPGIPDKLNFVTPTAMPMSAEEKAAVEKILLDTYERPTIIKAAQKMISASDSNSSSSFSSEMVTQENLLRTKCNYTPAVEDKSKIAKTLEQGVRSAQSSTGKISGQDCPVEGEYNQAFVAVVSQVIDQQKQYFRASMQVSQNENMKIKATGEGLSSNINLSGAAVNREGFSAFYVNGPATVLATKGDGTVRKFDGKATTLTRVVKNKPQMEIIITGTLSASNQKDFALQIHIVDGKTDIYANGNLINAETAAKLFKF